MNNREDNKEFGSHAEDFWEARRFLLELFRITGMFEDYKKDTEW